MAYDLGLIFYVWVLSLLLQIVVGSFLMQSMKQLVDGGWAAGRILGLLGIGLFIWFLGHLGMPVNTLWGINVTAVLILGAMGVVVIRARKNIREILKEKIPLIVIEEGLFLSGLVFMSLVRGFNPRILDLEKFMDMGLMNSYLQSATLPAHDMWLSGETINYYSFGHFLGSVLVRLWEVRMGYGYNLLLGFLMGLSLSLSFSVVINISALTKEGQKVRVAEIAGGLIGGLVLTLGGNSHVLWYWLTEKGFLGYWYADATRFIPNTIHEFPGYSFVVSDLHAHVWDLPIVLLLLLMVVGFIKSKFGLKWAGGVGGLLGVMIMTNTWDFFVYSLLGVILVIGLLTTQQIKAKRLIMAAMSLLVVMVVVALPFLLNFESISEGVRLVTERSTIKDLLILWSGHVVLSVLALGMAVKRKNLLLAVMVVTALALLLIPELVYAKDIYPSHPRANTMFKLTYQAFVLMSLSIGVMVGLTEKVVGRVMIGGVVLVLTSGFLAYPTLAFPGYYGEFNKYVGLDGEEWLREKYPEDYAGIEWLRRNASGEAVVLEAVGESYTEFARVSAYTGLQTVLGWRVHEWLWRGGFEIPGERTPQVEVMYQEPTKNLDLFEEYKIRYIFIGAKESEIYQIDERGLLSLGEVVFETGQTKIIELD